MSLHFRKQFISAETYESAHAWDVDGDGVIDIVSGAYWYRGPDFKQRFLIGEVAQYGEYYDDFSTIPLDVDGDGRVDFITGGWWGDSLRWRQCPVDPTAPWSEITLGSEIGNVETTRAWDIDGDGELEIVPNTPNSPLVAFKLIRDGVGKGAGQFSNHVLFSEPVGHGYGFGDIDGDGIGEFVTGRGIFKPLGDPLTEPWTMAETVDFGRADCSCPMLVVDVNGDGKNEVIVGGAHSYGLDWWERLSPEEWKRHPIDPFTAQYHDLQWADIDGDGQCELITGKRHRAHCGNEAGEADPLGIYYFKWNGEGFTKMVIDHVQDGGQGGGCGIHFALVDLNGNGRLDLVAPGKDGLYVYWNEGARP